MVQTSTSTTFMFSDEDQKMSILTRLVKEGHITLEEAFILSERNTTSQPVYVPQQPYTIEPLRVGDYPYPWFGINHPTTRDPIGPTWNTSNSSDFTLSYTIN